MTHYYLPPSAMNDFRRPRSTTRKEHNSLSQLKSSKQVISMPGSNKSVTSHNRSGSVTGAPERNGDQFDKTKEYIGKYKGTCTSFSSDVSKGRNQHSSDRSRPDGIASKSKTVPPTAKRSQSSDISRSTKAIHDQMRRRDGSKTNTSLDKSSLCAMNPKTHQELEKQPQHTHTRNNSSNRHGRKEEVENSPDSSSVDPHRTYNVDQNGLPKFKTSYRPRPLTEEEQKWLPRPQRGSPQRQIKQNEEKKCGRSPQKPSKNKGNKSGGSPLKQIKKSEENNSDGSPKKQKMKKNEEGKSAGMSLTVTTNDMCKNYHYDTDTETANTSDVIHLLNDKVGVVSPGKILNVSKKINDNGRDTPTVGRILTPVKRSYDRKPDSSQLCKVQIKEIVNRVSMEKSLAAAKEDGHNHSPLHSSMAHAKAYDQGDGAKRDYSKQIFKDAKEDNDISYFLINSTISTEVSSHFVDDAEFDKGVIFKALDTNCQCVVAKPNDVRRDMDYINMTTSNNSPQRRAVPGIDQRLPRSPWNQEMKGVSETPVTDPKYSSLIPNIFELDTEKVNPVGHKSPECNLHGLFKKSPITNANSYRSTISESESSKLTSKATEYFRITTEIKERDTNRILSFPYCDLKKTYFNGSLPNLKLENGCRNDHDMHITTGLKMRQKSCPLFPSSSMLLLCSQNTSELLYTFPSRNPYYHFKNIKTEKRVTIDDRYGKCAASCIECVATNSSPPRSKIRNNPSSGKIRHNTSPPAASLSEKISPQASVPQDTSLQVSSLPDDIITSSMSASSLTTTLHDTYAQPIPSHDKASPQAAPPKDGAQQKATSPPEDTFRQSFNTPSSGAKTFSGIKTPSPRVKTQHQLRDWEMIFRNIKKTPPPGVKTSPPRVHIFPKVKAPPEVKTSPPEVKTSPLGVKTLAPGVKTRLNTLPVKSSQTASKTTHKHANASESTTHYFSALEATMDRNSQGVKTLSVPKTPKRVTTSPPGVKTLSPRRNTLTGVETSERAKTPSITITPQEVKTPPPIVKTPHPIVKTPPPIAQTPPSVVKTYSSSKTPPGVETHLRTKTLVWPKTEVRTFANAETAPESNNMNASPSPSPLEATHVLANRYPYVKTLQPTSLQNENKNTISTQTENERQPTFPENNNPNPTSPHDANTTLTTCPPVKTSEMKIDHVTSPHFYIHISLTPSSQSAVSQTTHTQIDVLQTGPPQNDTLHISPYTADSESTPQENQKMKVKCSQAKTLPQLTATGIPKTPSINVSETTPNLANSSETTPNHARSSTTTTNRANSSETTPNHATSSDTAPNLANSSETTPHHANSSETTPNHTNALESTQYYTNASETTPNRTNASETTTKHTNTSETRPEHTNASETTSTHTNASETTSKHTNASETTSEPTHASETTPKHANASENTTNYFSALEATLKHKSALETIPENRSQKVPALHSPRYDGSSESQNIDTDDDSVGSIDFSKFRVAINPVQVYQVTIEPISADSGHHEQTTENERHEKFEPGEHHLHGVKDLNNMSSKEQTIHSVKEGCSREGGLRFEAGTNIKVVSPIVKTALNCMKAYPSPSVSGTSLNKMSDQCHQYISGKDTTNSPPKNHPQDWTATSSSYDEGIGMTASIHKESTDIDRRDKVVSKCITRSRSPSKSERLKSRHCATETWHTLSPNGEVGRTKTYSNMSHSNSIKCCTSECDYGQSKSSVVSISPVPISTLPGSTNRETSPDKSSIQQSRICLNTTNVDTHIDFSITANSQQPSISSQRLSSCDSPYSKAATLDASIQSNQCIIEQQETPSPHTFYSVDSGSESEY